MSPPPASPDRPGQEPAHAVLDAAADEPVGQDPWDDGPEDPWTDDPVQAEPSGAVLNRIVDAVVDRIEERVIDELERRGRHDWRVI